MKVSRETSDMRVQRSIEADARLRDLPKKAVNWPDPDKPRGERKPLKPIYVGSDGQRIRDVPTIGDKEIAA